MSTRLDKDELNDAEPLFSFPKLKEKLTQMGIEIGIAGTWRTVGTIDVLPDDIGKRILFEDNGIYFIDDNGVKRRGFMYKKAFYFEYQGKKNTPKFHVCQCKAIDNYGREAYRFANAEPIKVFSKNEKKEVEVDGLELCGYCRSLLLAGERDRITNSTDFVDILKEAGDVKEPTQVELDYYGYVKDWEQISLAYRTKMNFICKRCGIQIDDPFDRQFIHAHHRNGDKADNQELNLECLCIKCHSEVDEVHKQNFLRGANKVLLDTFIKKYQINMA